MISYNLVSILCTFLLISTIVESAKISQIQTITPQYNITQSMINAIHSSMAYCDRATIQAWNSKGAKQLQFQDPVYLYDKLTQLAGYIGYRPDTQSIVLSFRGSSNKPNWQEDFNVEMVPYPRCKDCFIHAGFYLDYSIISLRVFENIDKLLAKYPVKKLVATGHSLGGAVAIISGLEIKMNYGNKFDIEVHNFGQPRVCNANLAQYMKTKINSIFRVVHNQDIYVHLPFEWMKYVHVAREVFFSQDMQTYKICNESGEDPTCSNKYFPNYNREDHGFYFFDISNKSNCKLA